MGALTAIQVDIIIAVIDQHDIRHLPLKEELIDHYCCLVESYMDDGFSFESALRHCVSDFETSDLKEIENSILKQIKNKKVMIKNLVFLTSLLLLITSTFIFSQAGIPEIQPLKANFKISSTFGMQAHPISKLKRHHDGIDLSAPIGTPVYASADGKISIADPKGDQKFGKYIRIRHNEEYETFYAHLGDVTVKEGEMIRKGQMIGEVGTTGLSTGPHLHFEIIKNGQKIDPSEMIDELKL